MAVEYLLGDGLTFATAPRALPAELRLRAGRVQRAERRFYDTFDGRLYAGGLACVCSEGRLVLLDGGGELASVRSSDGRGRLFARELPAGALRDALIGLVDVRALLTVAQVRARTRTLAVLDDEQKTVARLVVEQCAVVRGGRRPRPLAARVRLAPVRGYDKALARVRGTLEQRAGLRPAARPLLDDAIIATGGVPGGVSATVQVDLAADMRAGAAAVLVLRRLLAVIEANLPGALEDVDAEFLHDLRVAVRRSRAVQRELRRVFPTPELAHFRAEFWLQRATGRMRDLDVYVLEFDDLRRELPESERRDLEPLLTVLQKRRAAARRAMARAVRSARAQALLRDWGQFLTALESGELADSGPDAALPIVEVVGARVAKVYGRMVRMGRAIDTASPPEAYHELRKKGKELRYLLELFASPLYPAEVVKPMIKVLKSLQDVLGRHQDREVQVTMLRLFGDAVAAQANGAAGLLVMGRLIERLEKQETAAREEFGERFLAFSADAQRKIVKTTFR